MLLCTMDAGAPDPVTGAEIKNGGLFVRDGVIEQVGKSEDLPETADTIIDVTGHVVIPGLVNTHHHLFLPYVF